MLYFIQYCSNWVRTWPQVELTKETPYLALTGELWGVVCEELGENWPRYNGTALYASVSWPTWWFVFFIIQQVITQINIGLSRIKPIEVYSVECLPWFRCFDQENARGKVYSDVRIFDGGFKESNCL